MALKELPQEAQEAANVIRMKQEDDWTNQLKLNSDGGVKTRSLYNIKTIIQNDDNTKNTIVYDEFADMIVVVRDMPSLKIDKGYWTDSEEAVLRNYIDEHYSLLFSKDNLSDAVIGLSKQKTINPVKKLLSLEVYMRLDGVHVHLYCFIVVVKRRPCMLFGSLKPGKKMAASPVLANSLKVVGSLRPCFENLVTRTVVKSSKKGRWVKYAYNYWFRCL